MAKCEKRQIVPAPPTVECVITLSLSETCIVLEALDRGYTAATARIASEIREGFRA